MISIIKWLHCNNYSLFKSIQMNSKSSSLIKCYFSSLLTIRSTHKRISYAHTPGDVPLLSFTAGQLLERAADKNPDKYAFIFTTPGFKITFQQLLQQVFLFFKFPWNFNDYQSIQYFRQTILLLASSLSAWKEAIEWESGRPTFPNG